MFYPAFIEPGSDLHAFGIQFPDLPGCFSATDNEQDIVAMRGSQSPRTMPMVNRCRFLRP